jgi:hypothetical protein
MARAILLRTFTALWWLCAILAIGWGGFWFAVLVECLGSVYAAGVGVTMALGPLPLLAVITIRWTITGRWRFGPKGIWL